MSMRKKVLLGSAAIMIAFIGIAFRLYTITRSTPIEPPSSTATSTSFLLPTTGSYVERAQNYTIATNYPTTTPLKTNVGAAADAAALAHIRNYIGDTIAQFKMGLTPLSQKETLQVVYLISSSPHTISYIFTIYENTGGAHANSFFKTFNFNTET